LVPGVYRCRWYVSPPDGDYYDDSEYIAEIDRGSLELLWVPPPEKCRKCQFWEWGGETRKKSEEGLCIINGKTFGVFPGDARCSVPPRKRIEAFQEDSLEEPPSEDPFAEEGIPEALDLLRTAVVKDDPEGVPSIYVGSYRIVTVGEYVVLRLPGRTIEMKLVGRAKDLWDSLVAQQEESAEGREQERAYCNSLQCYKCDNWHPHADGVVGSCIVEGLPVRVHHGLRNCPYKDKARRITT
jgi:hypothetical protein